jgi:predicted AAA+ superfamily ATPase
MFARRLANEKYLVYITGSNAKMLSNEVATTLGGHFFIIDVYPYSFKEFIKANQSELDERWAFSTIQVCYNLINEQTRNREIPSLIRFIKNIKTGEALLLPMKKVKSLRRLAFVLKPYLLGNGCCNATKILTTVAHIRIYSYICSP